MAINREITIIKPVDIRSQITKKITAWLLVFYLFFVCLFFCVGGVNLFICVYFWCARNSNYKTRRYTFANNKKKVWLLVFYFGVFVVCVCGVGGGGKLINLFICVYFWCVFSVVDVIAVVVFRKRHKDIAGCFFWGVKLLILYVWE